MLSTNLPPPHLPVSSIPCWVASTNTSRLCATICCHDCQPCQKTGVVNLHKSVRNIRVEMPMLHKVSTMSLVLCSTLYLWACRLRPQTQQREKQLRKN